MKVLVLGCRGWGRVHLSALSKLDVELEVYSRSKEAVQECASQFEAKATYTDLNDALRSNAEVADIVLPHDLHMPVAVKAMEMGKHVTVEKPMATTMEEAERMISTSKATGRKLMVTEQFHFDPSVRRVKELIEQGTIGKVHTIIVRSQSRWSGTDWRRKRTQMGGGALIDGGVHFVDTLLQFGGQYEEVKAYVHNGAGAIEGEDTTLAIFQFQGGAHGFLFYSWAYPNPPLLPRFEVVGDGGSIVDDVWDRPKGRMAPYGPILVNGRRVEIEDEDLYQLIFSQFLKAIQEDSEVPFSPHEAAYDLKATLDIYSSGLK